MNVLGIIFVRCGIPVEGLKAITDNDFRSFVLVHLSSDHLCLFQHCGRMDRIERVIYVDTPQPQSAVQNMFASYGQM